MDQSIEIIDGVLNDYKVYLGKHYEKYKNHAYRVFLLCQKMDLTRENTEKYAIAAAFHDLGIWTDKTFDYLNPSIKMAREYLKAKDKDHWSDEISLMIYMHHKMTPYEGEYKKTIETFRRADWTDVTSGAIKFSVSKHELYDIRSLYPTLGFHRFLLAQTVKNLLNNPLNPLPMFKK